MGEEDTKEIESKIRVGKPYSFPGPDSWLDRLNNFLVGRKIRVLSSKNLAEAVDQFRLQPCKGELPEAVVRFAVERPELREAIARFNITAEMNLVSSNSFVTNLRKNTPGIMREEYDSDPTNPSYENREEYSGSDLPRIADRWMLPALFFLKGGHWVLALKEPERHESGWRVLVYDPLVDHEGWMGLENWTPDYSDATKLWQYGAYTGQEGILALQRGTYNLSLQGDQELADNRELYEAKQRRIQRNSWDCGPLSLFAAALREGIKEGPNAFKFIGEDKLQKDTGVKILTREEIFGATSTEI